MLKKLLETGILEGTGVQYISISMEVSCLLFPSNSRLIFFPSSFDLFMKVITIYLGLLESTEWNYSCRWIFLWMLIL